jgi:hypothetical protein
MDETSPKVLLGAAGEHFVMYQLLRRGFTAALAPTGVPRTDILVTNSVGNRLCAIRVKTRRGPAAGGWPMSITNQSYYADLLFYVCVDVVENQPVCFVIPSVVVSETLSLSHNHWLTTTGPGGRTHKDNPVRALLPDYDRIGQEAINRSSGWLDPYRDAWHLIEHAAEKPAITPSRPRRPGVRPRVTPVR